MEKISSGTSAHSEQEKLLDRALDELLDNPEYSFLTTIPQNVTRIESAATAAEALAIAESLIRQREQRTFVFSEANIPGVESVDLVYAGVMRTLKEIQKHQMEIGVGGDAVVVVVETEMHDGTYDVCYKFAKQEETPRGRNTMEAELDLHSQFHATLSEVEDLRVGVPSPYYYSAIGQSNFIAMEKLVARSIDDLRRGMGAIPPWVTPEHIEEFCSELKRAIDICHEHNLYHRDLHFGNIMFTQSKVEMPNLGYIIDFGLSSHGIKGLEPYRKERGDQVFTYGDDYGRIQSVKQELMRLIDRRV